MYGVRQDVTSSAPYARPSHAGVQPSLDITCVLTVDLGRPPLQCKLAAMHTVAINNIITILCIHYIIDIDIYLKIISISYINYISEYIVYNKR